MRLARWILALYVVTVSRQVIAIDCNTDCDKYAEQDWLCGVDWATGEKEYCKVTNYTEKANCEFQKEYKCKVRKQIKKAEKVYKDSVALIKKIEDKKELLDELGLPELPLAELQNQRPSRYISDTYSAWKTLLDEAEEIGLSADELNKLFGGQYESNRPEKIAEVEGSGNDRWIMAPGREINERDAGDGLVAAGISVFDGGTALTDWVTQLLTESITTMSRSLQDMSSQLTEEIKSQMVRVAEKAIVRGIKTRRFHVSDILDIVDVRVQMKAGIVKYSGSNYIELPGDTKRVVTKTWGYLPFVAVRIKPQRGRQINSSSSDSDLPSDGFKSAPENANSDPLSRVVVVGTWGRDGRNGGIEKLVERLRKDLEALGVPAVNVYSQPWNNKNDYRPGPAPTTNEHLKDMKKLLKPNAFEPAYVALVGHSFGGWATARLSVALNHEGITPDRVFLLDPVVGPEHITVPREKNVKTEYGVNYYQDNSISQINPCINFLPEKACYASGNFSCGSKFKGLRGGGNVDSQYRKNSQGKVIEKECGIPPYLPNKVKWKQSHVSIDDDAYLQRVIMKKIIDDVRELVEKSKGDEVLRSTFIAPDMVNIRAGTFTMGTDRSCCDSAAVHYDGPAYSPSESGARKVTVAAFELAKTEVTRAQFRSFVEDTGYKVDGDGTGCETNVYPSPFSTNYRFSDVTWTQPGFLQRDDHPVVCIELKDAQAYISWLNEKSGKEYRLPTEAEWEYAARGGTTSHFSFGDEIESVCDHGNVANVAYVQENFHFPLDIRKRDVRELIDSFNNEARINTVAECLDGYVHTAPVGFYQENAFGLNDMHGNVAELVQDCYQEYPSFSYPRNAPLDGSAYMEKGCRISVIRGGAWNDAADKTRSGYRSYLWIGSESASIGFRLARSLD